MAAPVTAPSRTAPTVATAVVVAVCLLVTVALPVTTFTGAVATFVLSVQPTQIALDGLWPRQPGGWLAARSRPVRGGLLLAVALATGAVVETITESTVGAGRGPGTPQLSMFSIVAVVTAFWLANVLECWPFTLVRNRFAATAALLAAVYAVALALYYGLFDSSSLPPAPASPHGPFDAWHVLTFLVTAITAMFLPPAFGFVGMRRLGPPVRGLAWTALCLAWAGVLFGAGISLGVDPVDFLVFVPVPLLFGGLIVLVALRGSVFEKVTGPIARGVLNTLLSAVLGVVLVVLYRYVTELVHPSTVWGPPTYQEQVWIASATLAFTFPLLAAHANFFGHWPLAAVPDGEPPAPDTETASADRRTPA